MALPLPKLKASSDELKSTGPPVEIWRVIFSYLSANDLCHCACVNKEWNSLVDSIDSTRWKELYLQPKKQKRWIHPFWPNDVNTNPKSWKTCYRQRYLASRLWLLNDIRPSCSLRMFKRRRNRRTLLVGSGKTYHSIKGALDKANPYDEILVYPGLYQESSILHLRSPVAIIGAEESCKIVLMMQIDMQAESAKLENLTIKPMYPRARGRSNSVALVKAPYGHIFIHNCSFEQGYILVSYPGMADISSCTFDSAFLNMQGIGLSTVTNCRFNPDRCAIFIEDPSYPNEIKSPIPEETSGWIAARNEKKFDDYYRDNIKLATLKIRDSKTELEKKSSSFLTESSDDNDSDIRGKLKSRLSLKSRLGSFKFQGVNNKDSDDSRIKDNDSRKNSDDSCLDSTTKGLAQSIKGVIIKNILVSSGRGGVTICRLAQAWVECSTFCNLGYGVRCLNSSKCVLLKNKIRGCESTGIFLRDHSRGLIAGNEIYGNGEAGIDIRSCADPVVQHNEIHSGKRSGIVCLDGGKGLIRENDIHDNKEAGIYILHRGSPKVLDNFIWAGHAAGIAVTEHGTGQISHNIISGMEWAGIDIRHGGNPHISHNVIQNGHSDGIVIGEGGKSTIFDNHIDGNSGCGVWVLDGSHPLLHTNRIINSGKSGIAFVNNSDSEHDHQTLASDLPQQARIQNAEDGGADEQSLAADEEFMFPVIVPDLEPDSRFVHGIYVDVGVCCVVEGNGIYDNEEYGVTTAGVGTIKENDIFSCGLSALHLRTCADIAIVSNRFNTGKHECVYLDEKTRCTLNKNTFYISEVLKELHIHPSSEVDIQSNITRMVTDDGGGGETRKWVEEELQLSDPKTLRPIITKQDDGAPFYTTSNMNASSSVKTESMFCLLL